jgi:hypothetical protein
MKRALRIRVFALAALAFSPAIAAADVVLDWNRIMLTTIASQNPFAQARFAAITQLAVFEAVNACTHRYEPYLGTVSAAPGASAEAAAVAAAHAVLRNYFPGAAATLDAARAQSLATIRDGHSKSHGVAVGEAAAAAMILARATDGATPPETFLPATTDPGVWQPTPPAFGPGALLHWRNLTLFGLESNDQFRSAPPPALTSRQYTKAYREVMAVGGIDSVQRPQDRTDVARFFAAASAAYAWNVAAQQVSAALGRSLPQNARAFALINMAISDGLVASMETKYYFVFWRPVTAIRAGDLDGNPLTDADASWTPLVTTPSFPSYPSAHASASYAARSVAEHLFGEGEFHFTLTHSAVPGVTLDYTSFAELSEDIDDARVYGGIHFRFDQKAGARQGRQVGKYVYKHHLGSVHREHDKHRR